MFSLFCNMSHTQFTQVSLAAGAAHEGQVLVFLDIGLVLEEMLVSTVPFVHCLDRAMDAIQFALICILPDACSAIFWALAGA